MLKLKRFFFLFGIPQILIFYMHLFYSYFAFFIIYSRVYVKFVFIPLPCRWSYGIVLYEIFTIGNILLNIKDIAKIKYDQLKSANITSTIHVY